MLSTLANVVIAFTAFVGVAAAVVYYMKKIRDINLIHIFLAEAVYAIACIILIVWGKEVIR